MQRVFVLDRNKKPLMPCTPGKARKLLKLGRAAVYRLKPFTIILKDREGGAVQPVELKFDPGSKTTGIALVASFLRGLMVIWAANLNHRGDSIRKRLAERRAIRRGRRNRHTRYRAPRFDNRTRARGWLPPSLASRVDNVKTWCGRLLSRIPIVCAAVETVRFDTHQLVNPKVSGVGYQQGTLAGYEVREHLLEKWGRRCAYCGKENVPLEIEHIHPKSNGGSSRVSNFTLACKPCNQRKANRDIREFLAGKPEALKRIEAQTKAPLKEAAAINSIRYEIGNAVKSLLPTSFWSGGRTKFNRIAQGYVKDHWIDATCVGESGAKVTIPDTIKPLVVQSTGRGQRQVQKSDKYGFPRNAAGRVKQVHGFRTGDLARLSVPKGKYAGEHAGRIAGVRADGRFDLNRITSTWRNFQLLQRADGYAYS